MTKKNIAKCSCRLQKRCLVILASKESYMEILVAARAVIMRIHHFFNFQGGWLNSTTALIAGGILVLLIVFKVIK